MMPQDLTSFSQVQPTSQEQKPLFTIYQIGNSIELHEGRNESLQEQIYCSSTRYESAHRIAQVIARCHKIPLKDYALNSK